jgi:hypothetical protein
LAKAIGATSASDFNEKLQAFIDTAKKLEAAMADTVTLEALEKRVAALETKLTAGPGTSEARVTEMVAAAFPALFKANAESADGKKIIGAEASRITTEALASVGTQPVKPAPAPANPTPNAEFTRLEAEGKFEESFALMSKAEKDEFCGDAKAYAAFRKAQAKGGVRISNK